MRHKKKRKPGVQVKKYRHGGLHTDPPYVAASDATSVAGPDLQFLPVLQALSESQRALGPTIGPTTQAEIDAGSERYETEKRRQEAINRGVNPNLAFMTPPGLMGDSRAAAEYQYDNMLTSPIGQIATGMAFTPIDVGIDAVMPFLANTYLGRQAGRVGDFVGRQQERLAQGLGRATDYVMPGVRVVGDDAGQIGARYSDLSDDMRIAGAEVPNPSLSETRAGAREAQAILQQRKRDFLTNPVLQDRQKARITQQINTFYNETKANFGGTDEGVIKTLQAQKTGGADPDMDSAVDSAIASWKNLSSQVKGGSIPEDSKIVRDALLFSNQEIKNMQLRPMSAYGRDAMSPARINPPLDGPALAQAEQRVEQIGFEIPRAARVGDADRAMALDAERTDLISQIEASRQPFLGIRFDRQGAPVLDKQGNPIREATSYSGYDFGGGAYGRGRRPTSITVTPKDYRSADFLESVIEHEFAHATMNFDPGLRAIVNQAQLETTNQAARSLGSLVPRARVADIPSEAEARIFNRELNYFTQAGDPNQVAGTGSVRLAERLPMLSETRMRMVQSGAIDDIDVNVTTQDILNFYDNMYGPQQVRKQSSQPLFSNRKADRVLELFDPRTPLQDGSGRINADLLRDAMNTIPVIAAATAGGVASQEYNVGGKVAKKIKVLKKEGRPHDQAVAIALSMRDRNEL